MPRSRPRSVTIETCELVMTSLPFKFTDPIILSDISTDILILRLAKTVTKFGFPECLRIEGIVSMQDDAGNYY